ncbi:FG-nucleoporin nsp1 [Hypocenomyce scalaris]|nr:FG-nucleoporin nsp1 [Hypocenomyce scalaris]
MSDPPKSNPTFSFGSTPTSGGSGGSGLFGQSNTNNHNASGGLFGSGTSTPTTSGANPFGSFGATTGASQPSSTFGSTAAPTTFGQGGTSSGNLFGGAANSGSGFTLNKTAAATGQGSGFNFGKPTGSDEKQTSSNATVFPGLSTPEKSSDSASSSQAPKSGLFGNAGSAEGSSLFGNLGSNTASSSQAGNTTPAATKTSGGFSFGNPSTTPAGPPPSGKTSAAPSFSFNKPQEQKSGLFGNQNAAQPSTQETASTAAPSSTFSGFSQPSSGGLFGSTKPAESSSAASAAPTSNNLFRGATSSSGSNLFGNKAATHSSGGLSGNLNKSQDISGGSSPSSTTGSTAPTSAAPPQSQGQSEARPSNLFSGLGGQKSNTLPATQASGSSLFGGLGTQTSSKPAFSLSSATPATSAQDSDTRTATPTSGTAPGLFGNLGGAATSSATSSSATAASGGLFANLNKSADKAPESAISPLTDATSGPSTSMSSASASKPTMFGAITTPTSSSVPTQPPKQGPTASTAEAAPTSTTNLGTSTAGPPPPAQSRLKNKSMDEIITRWASDLSKYQKEFQAQAEKVAGWDRMLVENSEKIQKLYGSTLEAERATSEVERQLSAVEGNQEELAVWLDHYEAQVEQLMSQQVGQGEALQGPDQERERTYKLAEKLSDRMDEMGKDLTSMIEEINDASSSLSKNSKADDPLSQIVRILNSHLSQLQQIDHGAAALQAKVAAAQKASKSLGSSNGFNGLGTDAADDFYRSYMGRR